MFTGTATVCMHLHGIGTLKDKRKIVKSVIGRLKSKFNVSAAEIDRLDNKKVAIIGFAVVSNDHTFTASQLDTIISFIHNDGRFFLGDVKREIVSFEGD
ncbi:MAG: DUF503 domain-containing protein [Sedimentisphaerales bacterium]|nr:DUF503 domain-containing protein [Sedimentisphaerales bacterium]